MQRNWTTRRWGSIMILLAAANFAVLLLGVMIGEFPVPPLEALKSMIGIGDSAYRFVIHELRLPRALVAFLVGAGLALAGAVLQGLTRNPLAAPGVIGINSGAAALAVTAIVVIPAFPVAALPFAAFAGALAAALLSYALAWRRRGSSPMRMLLVGVGIAASANAYITFWVTTRDINSVKQAMLWLMGSTYGRTWEHFWSLLPWFVLLVPAMLVMARRLDVLKLGDELAIGLGNAVERTRALLLLACVCLAGASVAMAGTIGFIGLMGPHIARHLVGSMSLRLLSTSVLCGGLIVMTADLLGRALWPPIEIPAGIITAALGAPYLIYLLCRNRRPS
ncbi:iron ABC transporter permease [Paenibacillus sp. HB172176]|uniref:FecCD family ABC transporter permease n=1 Tax=Paenibacillus sp. HB172176 TaxID=2493690 RepID=UPI001F110A82|nr:iron ABC transporter permease [Paenibacillus sp. HB172176]